MLAFYVTLQSFIADRKNDDKGATAVEYGLMLALIAGAIILTVATLGDDLADMFTGVSGDINSTDTEFNTN